MRRYRKGWKLPRSLHRKVRLLYKERSHCWTIPGIIRFERVSVVVRRESKFRSGIYPAMEFDILTDDGTNLWRVLLIVGHQGSDRIILCERETPLLKTLNEA